MIDDNGKPYIRGTRITLRGTVKVLEDGALVTRDFGPGWEAWFGFSRKRSDPWSDFVFRAEYPDGGITAVDGEMQIVLSEEDTRQIPAGDLFVFLKVREPGGGITDQPVNGSIITFRSGGGLEQF